MGSNEDLETLTTDALNSAVRHVRQREAAVPGMLKPKKGRRVACPSLRHRQEETRCR